MLTFGDSWPAGVELQSNEIPFGQCLANLLNCEFQNCSVGATPIEHMVIQLDQYLKTSYRTTDKICAIFFITNYNRTLVWNEKGVHGIFPWANDSNELARIYFKYFQFNDLDKFRANMAILALQKICSDHNIDDRYIVGWRTPGFDYSGINCTKFYPKMASELMGITGDEEFSFQHRNNPYVYPNNCHPNQLGHKLIANNLYEWIKNDISN